MPTLNKAQSTELNPEIFRRQIINWYITPNTHTLKGDISLTTTQYMIETTLKTKNDVVKYDEFQGIMYRYDDLGQIQKSKQLDNKNYIITIKRGENFLLDWTKMDRYFSSNHLKFTQEYLKELLNGFSYKSELLCSKKNKTNNNPIQNNEPIQTNDIKNISNTPQTINNEITVNSLDNINL